MRQRGRFTGQRWQDTIGLYDYRARWYDPALGRFISADTLVPEPGDPQSLNRFSYCRGNPVTYTDPTGHAVDLGGAAAGSRAWQEWLRRYRAAHYGFFPSEQTLVEYRLSVIHPGTGQHGSWTEDDWAALAELKRELGPLLYQLGREGSRSVAQCTALGWLAQSSYLYNRGFPDFAREMGPDGTQVIVGAWVPENTGGITLGELISAPRATWEDPRERRFFLLHEYVHVLQYRREGVAMLERYRRLQLYAWTANPYEVQAVNVEMLYRRYDFLPDLWDIALAGWRL